MPHRFRGARRLFLRRAALAAAAVPIVSLGLPGRAAYAEELPKAEDNHAQDYVNDAADAADHEQYEEGTMCENCAFWTGEETNGWGGCAHPEFADVLVNAEGWCAAYAPGG